MVKKGLAIRHEPNRPDPTRPDRGQKLFWNYRFSHVFFFEIIRPCMFVQFPGGESQTNYQFRRIFWGMLRSEDKVRFWMLDLDATQASG